MRFLPLLLLAVSTANAQDAALRLGDADPRSLSLVDLVSELHAVFDPMEEEEPILMVPVVLSSALVADGEVFATGRSEFLALAVEQIERGPRLRADLPREYRAARAETALRGDLFVPANLVGGGETQFPGEMLFPGENFFPGEMLFPGDMGAPERNEASVRLAGTVVAEMSARPDERALIRAAERMDREAYESGEPFLIFFVTRADGERTETEMMGFLRKRPGR